MNALESASLVMIPSGYEDGTLGSLKPTDGSGDFTFSRGSDISATRVNEDGYIEKGYENLLTYSNVFNQGYPHWATSGVNIPTGNQIGYDGSSDAWILERNATNGFLYAVTSQSGVNTFSVYAKANTADFVALREVNGYGMVYFDLSNGTIGTSTGGNVFAKSIDSVGNGWYRCSIHISGSSLSQVRIHPTTQNGSTSGTSGSIYIQDAMLNQGLVAYPYIETTTAPVAGGILEDMPRLDYSGGSCPALLLEPQRTNNIKQSEYLNGITIKTGGYSIDSNQATSPEGKNNASQLEIISTGQQYIGRSFTLAGDRVISAFVKYNNSATRFYLGSFTTTNDVANAVFDIENGTILSETTGSTNNKILEEAAIEDYGNGWYRCWVHISGTSGVTAFGISDEDSASLIPQLSTTGINLYAWGFQCEEGTYPTSYIPTYGTTQTRLTDDINRLDISSLAATYQTLFIEASVFSVSTAQYKFSINDATGSRTNRFTIFINNDDLSLLVNAQGSSQPSITQNDYISANTTYKIAAVVRDGSYALFANGTKIGEQVGTTPSNLNSLTFGDASNPLNQNWEGNVNQALIFPTALSDDECIELTTI